MKQIKIKPSDYKITAKINLGKQKTHEDFNASEDDLKEALSNIRREIGEFQENLYAHGKYGVLICLQGMDTAGKDSLIREVFKDFNSSGIVVHSFKQPSERELKHDYLWRHYIALPERGKFGVFNRTHYENVLVTRVHPEYILNEGIPKINDIKDINPAFWEKRFRQINDFERHISENGIMIFKFFLHISKAEQKKRLLRRINKKEKNWKFSPGDFKERKLWNDYHKCYEEAINKTSTPYAPWYVIPADHKKASRAIVASILIDELTDHENIRKPELEAAVKARLETYKKQLEAG